MRFEIIALIILGIIWVPVLGAHLHYFVRITDHIKRTTERDFMRNDLKAALSIPQGSNFNTVMLLSWNLFLVALAFLLFLTPSAFSEWNYFKFSDIASSSYGLSIFGAGIVLIPGLLVSLFVPQAYRYYLINKNLKELNLLTPLLLIISILSSVYLGTIYPVTDFSIWIVGYGFLLISLALLVAPVVIGYREEMRT
jgi:hypothetical protein